MSPGWPDASLCTVLECGLELYRMVHEPRGPFRGHLIPVKTMASKFGGSLYHEMLVPIGKASPIAIPWSCNEFKGKKTSFNLPPLPLTDARAWQWHILGWQKWLQDLHQQCSLILKDVILSLRRVLGVKQEHHLFPSFSFTLKAVCFYSVDGTLWLDVLSNGGATG